MTDILSELMGKIYERRKLFSEKWKRTLPLNEMISGDRARWEKAEYLKFGKNSSIYDASYVFGDVKVGEGTWIGPLTILDGSGGLVIGDYCCISAGVQIYTHDAVKNMLTKRRANIEYKPVKIGNCSFIGAQSFVQMGLTIGDYCVVGANSFLNIDLPDNSIAFGNPAKIRGKVIVDEDDVKFLYP